MALMGRSNSLASFCAFASACTSFSFLCLINVGLQSIQPSRVEELYRKEERLAQLMSAAILVEAMPEADGLGTLSNGISSIHIRLIHEVVRGPEMEAWFEVREAVHDQSDSLKTLGVHGSVGPIELLVFVPCLRKDQKTMTRKIGMNLLIIVDRWRVSK
jgi:hypothetical protein